MRVGADGAFREHLRVVATADCEDLIAESVVAPSGRVRARSTVVSGATWTSIGRRLEKVEQMPFDLPPGQHEVDRRCPHPVVFEDETRGERLSRRGIHQETVDPKAGLAPDVRDVREKLVEVVGARFGRSPIPENAFE